MGSIFGWDLPPGCTTSDLPGNQPEGPCDVCGLPIDDCICPECPECGAQGDPSCYEMHGLVRTAVQVASKEKADREAREANERMCAEEMRMEQIIEQGLEEDQVIRPVWQLPAPTETARSADAYVRSMAKYHCFVDDESLCGRYKQDTDYFELGMESGEILKNPHFACKKCYAKWLKRYLPEVGGDQ